MAIFLKSAKKLAKVAFHLCIHRKILFHVSCSPDYVLPKQVSFYYTFK